MAAAECSSGDEPTAAIERVAVARGCSVPETAEQRRWIADFTKSLVPVHLK